MIEISHRIPRQDVALGIVRAENLSMARYPGDFEERLADVLRQRLEALSEGEERRRGAARDMLRNGGYKPTGRGKPASEYLLRSAQAGDEGAFPRINAAVDACNLISLKYLVPVSIWDMDLAGTERYVFRTGGPGESYVFNQGGQVIDVADLIVGCAVRGEGEAGTPIVNPVKDSMATKTTPETRRVAGCVYFPLDAFSQEEAREVCREFAGLLGDQPGAAQASGTACAGETISV